MSDIEQKPEPQFQLTELKPDEIKAVTEDLEALMAKHGTQFVVSPIIQQDGRLGAQLQVFKKVELVPKGVPSPAEFLPSHDESANESGTAKEV